MEIHEEFRIKINDPIKSWCYYPPLDVIVYEGNHSITIIEAATGCINKTFNFSISSVTERICIDVIGKQKLALARGNVFNCRSKFNDVLLCDSMFQTVSSDCSDITCIDLPKPEAQMLLEVLKTVPIKWDNRHKFGFQCSLELDNENSSENVWKWNLVTFHCPSTVLVDWLTEINMEMNDNFPALPLISSIIYRIKCLQLSDYAIRLSIFDRFKEVMNIEANRFLSFEMWPHKTYKWATPELMAKVGFYHHPRRINDDRALCFLCNICLITWEATDEPWSEHQRHSPSCPLFKQNYTSNVPLSITEATTTAQKQNSSNNITLIAKSIGNRYVATISEDGHICIWDTCYLFRKIAEFDTPLLSKDGSITIDSACLIDNPLIIKSLYNDSDEIFPGFHVVLGARFIPNSEAVAMFLQPQSTFVNCDDSNKVNYIYSQQRSDQVASFLIVIEVAYQCSLISQDERSMLYSGNDYSTDDYRLHMDEDMPYDELNDLQYHDTMSAIYKEVPLSHDEQTNVKSKSLFFSDLSLHRLWDESKVPSEVVTKQRDIGDTNVVHIVPLVFDCADDGLNDSVRVASIYPIVMEFDEECFEAVDVGSSVYLMVNIQRDVDNEEPSVGGALSIYRFQVDGPREAQIKPTVKLQHISSTILPAGENVENLFPISLESLESNCSESSSTANADEIPPEPMTVTKTVLSKSSFYWLLLTSNSELFLLNLPLNHMSSDPVRQPISEVATKINIKKELSGLPRKLLLFSDMDRLCLLTEDGFVAFYTIVPRKKSDSVSKTQTEDANEKISENATKPKSVNVAPIIPDPLIVDQSDIADRLGLVCDFIQYEIVTSRLKLTYGCNWVEVSPLEIIDFKTSNVSNFISVSRCFIPKTGVQSEPPFLISGSPYMKISDQQQCCTRTLNFRSSQTCSREQIIEFSTAKQLCLGHVDLRFELYEKINKNSNLIYVTLLRQQKFNGSNPPKEQTTGSIKVNTSSECNIIINDLEAPFIDDDLAQYYDEVNSDVLRKLDGEIVAGPYLLNKYCQSDSTSVFLSMTSAELLKCRSRHYAIHMRIRSRRNSEVDKKQSSSTLNMSPNTDRYSVGDTSNLNIKSISLTLRKFSKPQLSIRNERQQRLAILRNHKFLRQILDLLVDQAQSKIPKPLMQQYCFDILNWIVVMYLNDIKPHSEKIHRIISIVNDYVHQLILLHLVQGDRSTSKMMAKTITGLIKLESRFWNLDSRPSINLESSYFQLSRSVHCILQTHIEWLLKSSNSVAIHNYLLILDSLDQLTIVQQPSMVDYGQLNNSLVSKLSLLSLISLRYSETMSSSEDIYLRTILGYPHNPLTGDLFDVVNDNSQSEPVNTLYWNMTEMYSKKPVITLDGTNNDSISKYLMHTFHDHSLKHIQDQLNEQISSIDDKVTNDFSIDDLKKVYQKMVMTNVSNNIHLMSPDVTGGPLPPTITITETPEQVQSNLSNMTWPGFDPFFLSKMNSKQIIYSDMKKKLKSGQTCTVTESLNPIRISATSLDHLQYKINPARKSSILEVDVLSVFFECGSEGTCLETSDFLDPQQHPQFPGRDSNHPCDWSPNMSIPLLHMMDGTARTVPATPKTTPAITTQTTPQQNSPVQSPGHCADLMDTSSSILNQQRLRFSQFTSNLLSSPCSYHIVVNRLHANARRHVILDLRQLSIVTDILIPTCDKLQKIVVRVGRTKNEDEMQTIVVHSKIATDPLLLLNIQPRIICNFVQIIVIAKSNITATRNRINIGHLYGRAAILPWELGHELMLQPTSRHWVDTVVQVIDQMRPQVETVSIRYSMARETLKHLLGKCVKTGINQQILSQAMTDHHLHHRHQQQQQQQHQQSKGNQSPAKPNTSLLQLITQVNNAYNKCCQLQQHLSIMNNQMKQYQALLTVAADPEGWSQPYLDDCHRLIGLTTVDKLRVLMEFLLESLLLDKAPYFEVAVLRDNMTLISGIMTNVMWYGNREMQILMVSWIPKLITKSNDIPETIKMWCHNWLLDFLLNTFTNKTISLLSLNKEEIFSSICVIFQRLSNAGYHFQLLRNVLDILIVMLQPYRQNGNEEMCYIDIELLNWMMLFIDFTLSWIGGDPATDMEEQFTEWKFLFWSKSYDCFDDQSKIGSNDCSKDKMNNLKQTLLQLNGQKQSFIDYMTGSQYDPWFSELIMTEYMNHYVKLSVKITAMIAKMKKSLSVNKTKKTATVSKGPTLDNDFNPRLTEASTSIATTIKLILNTLKCMDFQVSQDTFIVTCMVLTKLFVLVQNTDLSLNDFIDKDSIHSIVERAFKKCPNIAIGLDVYSLHASKLLLSEIVRGDVRTLAVNSAEQYRDDGCQESQKRLVTTSQDPGVQEDCAGGVGGGMSSVDNDSVDNDDEDDPDNEEEDITPTGADDEEMTTNADEPYTLYITHLGNIAKQKDNNKNNEESPSDEYVDIVEEFDFLGQPTTFIPTYHKDKFPKEYPSSIKTVDMQKHINVNSFESNRSDKSEPEANHSVLYYDLRLENTIFAHQEVMFNHSFLNWMHQIRVQLYSQIPPCLTRSTIQRPTIATVVQPLTIGYVLESISQLILEGRNINLEELVIFMSSICHHLQKVKLLSSFDSLGVCSVYLEELLDLILERCSEQLMSLSLYCQLICFLLEFQDYSLKQCHFQRIFQLTDSLQCQELNDDVVSNFRIIVTKSLNNIDNNAEFFLEILYNIVENCHKSSNELRASGQLASVIMECSKGDIVDCILRSPTTFLSFLKKIVSLTKSYLHNPDSINERKCFASLVPQSFTSELLRIEKALISNSPISVQIQSTALVHLNQLTLELMMTKGEALLSFIDEDLLQSFLETLADCSSSVLDCSKLSDVTLVAEDLVLYSQCISIADIVWRQFVLISQTIILASLRPLETQLLSSLLTVLRQSLPNINEPLFFISIWLLNNIRHPEDDIDYSELLAAMVSVIVCCSDSRLSNAPVNTVTTRMAIAKMHRYNAQAFTDQSVSAIDGNQLSNSSRLNVAPYCKIICNGNDSSDPLLLRRILSSSGGKSTISSLRTNRLKPTDVFWSYEFFPHETSVELIVLLPCDMIVHKVILQPKSIRDFSAKFELITIREVRDISTITYQQVHRPVSNSDGVLIDQINSNQLSNKIILKFEKPVSSKLVLNKLEIFTINQWWDHRFQVNNDRSNLCVFRCLHLFNHLIGITSATITTFIADILPRNTKFFTILLNWNQFNSSSTLEQLDMKILNRSICALIESMFVELGQRSNVFSELFIREILTKVSLRHSKSMTVTEHGIHFTSEISMMELNIFFYLLTVTDSCAERRLRLVLDWLVHNVMKDGSIERNVLIYHDSVASIVYLLAVVLCRQVDSNLCRECDPNFVINLQRTIVRASGFLKKALYRLLCSVCSVDHSLYLDLLEQCPVISPDQGTLDRHNLKSILWASRSRVGSSALKELPLLMDLVRRIEWFLGIISSTDLFRVYEEVCTILKFLSKLCVSGCYSIKTWLGSADISGFWATLLDYLINESHYSQNVPSSLKMKLISASVKFFRAVTLCCEDNQSTFVKIFIEAMERYRMRSDTIVLSNPLRQLILDVIVKEPVYSVVISMAEPSLLFRQYPGWLISSDELGRCRLSFKHPALGYESNCIFIDKLPMTGTVSTMVTEIADQISIRQRSSEMQNIGDRSSTSCDVASSLVLTYRGKIVPGEMDIFDLLTIQEREEPFTCGFIRLSASASQADLDTWSLGQSGAGSAGHLLVKFTDHGGLRLLSLMMPLLYADIRRLCSISSTQYRPTSGPGSNTGSTTTATSVSNSMGFIDDEMSAPAEVSRVVKSLPLIPAHSITALCLFLQIDLYPAHLVRHHPLVRSPLIHLLLGITDDQCGVSLLLTHPQLQCLPFTILSDLLQDPALTGTERTSIVTQCIDLGLIDFFISLLSILGHVDSGLAAHSLKCSGPWASFLSQSLSDLHHQLFSPPTPSQTVPVPASASEKPGDPRLAPKTGPMDSKSPYITFMPFIDEKKNYWAKGTGFGTGGMYSTWDSEYVLLRQRLEETNASAILDTLSALISSSDEECDNLSVVLDHNEDLLPPRVVESIYKSTLLSFVCCYLRNDSVLDVSQHVNIYKAVLRLIRATARHRCLHYLLFPHLNPPDTNPDLVYSFNQISSMSSVNVSQLLFQLKICVDTYINRLKKAPGSATKSAENTRRLTRQFSIRRKNTNYSSFLQRINDALKTSKDGAGDSKEDPKMVESENLTLLIPEINGTLRLLEDVELDIVERNKRHEVENRLLLEMNGPHTGLSSPDDSLRGSQCESGKTSKDIETRYMDLMKKLQFGMFEMISPVSDENGKIKFTIPYHFKKNVENAVTSQSSAASLSRARRLAQETVTLSTSLPLSYSSSVFVRCDENHLDIMKVIIIGPPDTPYANGCFEFDVYFPPDYPKTPPLLNLQTTGNGSVRFNPNLYNEGKVCLSILNTWHGRPEERWSSRTSSFLQVLVSIQSLILVSEPYFNEPGYERSRGTPSGNNASKAYSANIQAATSRWAILEMMKNPPLCFADVIKKHFLLKKDEILNQIQSWIDIYLDPCFDQTLLNNTRPSIANSVQNLKKNLVMIKKEYDNLSKEDLLL